MQGSEILFVDVPYNSCKLINCPCSSGDCRVCCVPIIMRDEARKILENYKYY